MERVKLHRGSSLRVGGNGVFYRRQIRRAITSSSRSLLCHSATALLVTGEIPSLPRHRSHRQSCWEPQSSLTSSGLHTQERHIFMLHLARERSFSIELKRISLCSLEGRSWPVKSSLIFLVRVTGGMSDQQGRGGAPGSLLALPERLGAL